MADIHDVSVLANALPGNWTVGATSLPGWSFNPQVPPRFAYQLVTALPLVLSHEIVFESADGKPKSYVGTTRWRGRSFLSHTGRFTLLKRGRWSVNGLGADGNVLAFTLSKALTVPESIFVLTRVDSGVTDLRALVASGYAAYGLTPEQFASLTWL